MLAAMTENGAASPCPVCGSRETEHLLAPHPLQSVTSSAVIVNSPLQKIQCLECGLLRQLPIDLKAKNDIYRDEYGIYYQRLGTVASEAARYSTMANRIFAEIGTFQPLSVLDVGCGAGLFLDAMRRVRPTITYAGIEPSIENSEKARTLGFAVANGFVPGTAAPGDAYDLVVTTHVVTHIRDTVGFLSALAAMTAPAGLVGILFYRGSQAGADLLWADVEYSFCRMHLIALASKAGLELSPNSDTNESDNKDDTEILYFKRPNTPSPAPMLSVVDRDRLLDERRRYFAAWRQLAARIEERSRNRSGPLMNFGASFWTMLLAAYCPEYWSRVTACIVDSDEGSFLGKPVIESHQLSSSQSPLLVLGTNPKSQASLARRFSSLDVVTWDDLIGR